MEPPYYINHILTMYGHDPAAPRRFEIPAKPKTNSPPCRRRWNWLKMLWFPGETRDMCVYIYNILRMCNIYIYIYMTSYIYIYDIIYIYIHTSVCVGMCRYIYNYMYITCWTPKDRNMIQHYSTGLLPFYLSFCLLHYNCEIEWYVYVYTYTNSYIYIYTWYNVIIMQNISDEHA